MTPHDAKSERGSPLEVRQYVDAAGRYGELAEAPSPMATEALRIWNEIAPRAGWPEARFLTQARRVALRRAILDYGGLVGWKSNLEQAATSDFLTGKSARDPKHANWRPDLDWFLKPANVVKILERKFGGTAPLKQSLTSQLKATGTDWRARLDRYRKGGFWHVDTDGPRPEDAGPHKAPAELIEAWRKRHGIVERRAETLEERYEAKIVSFRRHGMWAKANEAEEELARLQGRPPVLVPAPDARDPDVMPAPPQAAPERQWTDMDGDWSEVPEGDEALSP